MRPLIYFPKEKDGSIYQTARLRKNIKAAFEHLNVPYYEKNRGNIDIALFGSLRNKDINQIKKCKKRNIPTIFFALYQESDSFSELVKIKRTGQLYISKKDLDSLNEIDLILVPSEEAKRYLKSFGVNAEIKTLFTPVNVERFNSEHVLEKTIFNRYFRLKEDTKIIIGTTNTKNVEGVEMFSTLANRFQDYVFFYFIETNSFKDRFFVKKLANKNPSNLIVRSLVNDDVFRSGLMNANFYIETSNKKVGTLSLVDTFASETHLIACKNAIYNDVVDENVASVYLTLENIINIIEKGESSYDKQRKNALKRAEKASISNFANKLKEIIETLLNKKKAGGKMIDINLIRSEPEKVKASLLKKGWDVDFTSLLALDKKRRELRQEVEESKAKQNELSASVAKVKKEGGDTESIFTRVKQIKAENTEKEELLKKLDQEIQVILDELPNMPDDDLKPGGKENNEVIKTYFNKPTFSFKTKDHVELCESLGLIDYKRAAKISGAGTWIYTNLGARLEWALINYFIDEHLKDGYEMVLPPHLLNEASGYTAGQFPKFKSDVFWLKDMEPARFLLPTAETALVNFHRNEILTLEDLPKKYFAYTPCYRSEAGSYRTEERGMIRGYQFNKVEIVQYATKEGSDKAFEELVNKAIRLVEKLGLHFVVSKLAAGDCSHSMARTYDIEVYIPSMDIYKEVSSASNARCYQARRGMIRYRDKNGQIEYCHTLNASGLATSRLFPAILEQNQQEDGSVIIPEVLRSYLGGLSVLKPKK